jgi:hypothetical protein
MVRWMAAAALPLLLAAALAGCSGKAAPGQDPAFLDAQPTEGSKGAISGVVVDEAIRPIAGANVTLGSGLASTRTDAQGRFAFPGVEPGFVTLVAKAKGYFAIQATAEVVAGEMARVRVQMPADRSPVPYHTTSKFKGFIQAWAGIAQFFVEDVYATATGNGTTLCQCYYDFTPDANLTGMVLEAVWADTMPRPTGTEDAEYYTNVNQPGSSMFEQNYCHSPCHIDVSLGSYKPGPMQAYMQGPDLYLSFQQNYDLYVSLFYRAAQPKDWSFVAGDA